MEQQKLGLTTYGSMQMERWLLMGYWQLHMMDYFQSTTKWGFPWPIHHPHFITASLERGMKPSKLKDFLVRNATYSYLQEATDYNVYQRCTIFVTSISLDKCFL